MTNQGWIIIAVRGIRTQWNLDPLMILEIRWIGDQDLDE